MPSVQKSLVSKVRAAAEGLPALQEWLLESAPQAWVILDTQGAGVYCIFRRRVCLYVGQSHNVAKRIYRTHSIYKEGDVVIYLSMPKSSSVQRKNVEQSIAEVLRPRIGMIRGLTNKTTAHNCYECEHQWQSRSTRIPAKCPNPKCQSPNWDKRR